MKRFGRWFFQGGSVLICVGVAVGAWAQKADTATIQSLSGACQIRPADSAKWQEAKAGTALHKGDGLLAGPECSMVLALGSVARVQMEAVTELTLGEIMVGDAQAPVGIDLALTSGTLLVSARKPEGQVMELMISTATATAKTSETASFIFQDSGAGEATLKVGEGQVSFWNAKFPDRASMVGAYALCTVRQDTPDGVVRGVSVAERTDLDRLEPLKKEVSPAWATAKQKEEGQKEIRMPQGHYGMMLARAMDLEKQILGHTNYPAISNLGSARDVAALGGLEFTANMDDYLDALSARGIEPLDGWNKDALLTKGVMAVVLVRAYGIEDQIPMESRGDELAFMNLLGDMGIVIDGNPGDLVNAVIVINIMTDPILVPVLGETFFQPPSPALAVTTMMQP